MDDNGELLDKVLGILESGDIPPRVNNQFILAGLHHQFHLSKQNRIELKDHEKRIVEIERDKKERKEAKKGIRDTYIKPLIGAIIGAVVTIIVVKFGLL
jgi:hypothetical protein